MYSSPPATAWMVPVGPNQKLAGMLAGLNSLASENWLACLGLGGKAAESRHLLEPQVFSIAFTIS